MLHADRVQGRGGRSAARARRTATIAAGALALALCSHAPFAAGERAPELAATVPAEVDPAAIEARIATLEKATELDARVRSQAVAALQQALAARRELGEQQEAERRYDALLADGRARIDAALARAEVAERRAAAPVEPPESDDLRELQSAVERAKAELATVTTSLTAVRRELADGTQQPAAIRDAIVREQAARDELRRQLDATAADTSLAAAAREALTLSLRARIETTRATIARLQKQLLAQPVREELLRAQRRELLARRTVAESLLSSGEQALARAQRSESLRAIADAGLDVPEAAARHPAVQRLRAANITSAERLTDLGDRIEATRAARDDASARVAELREAFERAQRRLEVAGARDVIGRVLLAERRALPSVPEYRSRAEEREDVVRQANLLAIELEEERAALDDRETYRTELPGTSPEPDAVVQRTITALLDGREALVERILETNAQYLDALAELAFEEEALLRAAGEFETLLSRRLLWLRTRDIVSLASLRGLPAELRHFIEPAWWWNGLRGLARGLAEPLGLLGVLLALWLLSLRRRLRAALARTSEGLHKPSEDGIGRTFRALGITLLLAVPVPLLAALAGLSATRLTHAPAATAALGHSLVNVAPLALALLAIRKLTLRGGVFEAHLRWDGGALRRLRRRVTWLWPTLFLPALLNRIAIERREGLPGEELDRALLVLLLAGLAFFLHRLLAPRGGIAWSLRGRGAEDTSTGRRRAVWLLLGPTGPLLLGALALYGYLFSAQQLLTNFLETLGLLGLLVLLQELIQRWLLIARRRIQLQQILQRRAAAAREADDAHDEPPAAPGQEVDLTSLDKDTRALVRTFVVLGGAVGVFLIWSELLPALTVFEDVTLWRTSAGTAPGEGLRPVSLADVLLALLLAFLTFVAARNGPALLEIALRQQATMVRGSRVAFATLSRYGIVVLGAFVVLSLLGASWSRLQWLIAALGVGIGFGLQEIIANFISGLIILVERPIRVGDVVSVGEVEGIVTRIQIRATTVTNWDSMEHLIPNRELITGRVLNWSLTNEVTRLVVPVGVAYGTDVAQARKLLLASARDHGSVADDPAPFFFFSDFGDDALMLELRCHVAHIGDRLRTLTELREDIYARFRSAGITIAFPQRDVHLTTPDAIEVRFQRGDDSRPAAG